MKNKTITLLITFAICLSASARRGILVAQFGTSNEEGRQAALEVLYGEIASENPQYTVREAYTSPTIRRILHSRGVEKPSATDALLQMYLDGIDTVYVQPTFLLDGVEMQMLRDEASAVSHFFKHIQVGVPLLYTIEDFKNLASLLANTDASPRTKTDASPRTKTDTSPRTKSDASPRTMSDAGTAVMYVGHGNEYASTSAYSMLGQMISSQNPDIYIGTIEGWPDLETSVSQLRTSSKPKTSRSKTPASLGNTPKAMTPASMGNTPKAMPPSSLGKGKNYEKVTLIPLLLACGVHAHEDIDEEWRPAIEELGLDVDVQFRGLGEDIEVRSLIKNHLSSLLSE